MSSTHSPYYFNGTYGQSARSRDYSRCVGYVPRWTKPRRTRKPSRDISWKRNTEKWDETARLLLGTGSIYDPRSILGLLLGVVCLFLLAGAPLLYILRPALENVHRRAIDRARRERRLNAPENPLKHKRFDSFNPPPAPETLRSLWASRNNSHEAALAFGSALNDLEATVDNRSISSGPDRWRGRRPGLKGWLRDNCPDIAAHYAVALRLKRTAQRLRDASEMTDPCPPEWLLPHSSKPVSETFAVVSRLLPAAYRYEIRQHPVRWIYHRYKTRDQENLVPLDFLRSRNLAAALLDEFSSSLSKLDSRLRFLLGLCGA